ncbi:MAG: Enolase [Parcubacteria group bacterium GW2011_GWA1_47_10]|nr:MAG: Enolase [Parcubacteria group bacterium GW2011_GWA1_47_10]KKU97621.1 MAG: Enolase [Parcubacteria group bacterium GW2011_GWB1_48_6]
MVDNYPITKITAEEIKDSRGNPTLKVTVEAGNYAGSFSVPSGASTGAYEAVELRDPEPEQARYGAGPVGRGVKMAIRNVNEIIAPALAGMDISGQRKIDEAMLALDGTENKKNLGANAMIGVSIACAKAAARAEGPEVFEYLRTLSDIKPSRKVPYLYMNLLNGGKHAQNGLAFQEYMIAPETSNPAEALEIGILIQNTLKENIIKKLGQGSAIFGDEGGFAPKVNDVREPLYLLHEAIKQNGLEGKVRVALDVAATSFYADGRYQVGGKNISAEELLDIYRSIEEEFRPLSIEDPFEENDFESFSKLTEYGTLVVGDDLMVTNVKLLRQAIKKKSVRGMIIKPNQIGTLTETLETMKLARENGIELIISHRSGETEDDFIADLAYAFGCFGLKAGAPSKPERLAKYNRLLKIASLSN